MNNNEPNARKLWEAEHSGFPSTTSYDGHGPYEYSPWAKFYAEFGTSDPDHNLVFRWDWFPKGHEQNWVSDSDLLLVFFMCQRKGLYWCDWVRITPEDEPQARAWLVTRWEHLKKLWAPISDELVKGQDLCE